MKNIKLSMLPHTWIIDIDGTILKHNGYKVNKEELLTGTIDFFKKIPESDFIILITGRKNSTRVRTLNFLKKNKIRFDLAIFNLPLGERILINDQKKSGLNTSISVNLKRDFGLKVLNVKYCNKL
jgi:hypothetical protein